MEITKDLIDKNLGKIRASKPIYVGKSKIVYKVSDDHCLVELIPTLTSFTYKRHQLVEGTDKLRLDFYDMAIEVLSANGILSAYKFRVSEKMYVSELCSNPPFEVIVKNRAIGSTLIKYPGLFPMNKKFDSPIVKFDYRIDPEDTPIAEDYIREYGLDVELMKSIALKTNSVLSDWLKPLELYDFCIVLGIDNDGRYKIISEISPDGMRLRSTGNESFDKDLFRRGEKPEVIVKVWSDLIANLQNKR